LTRKTWRDGRRYISRSFGGHKAVIQLLLEQKADVDAKDIIGRRALHITVSEGHKAVIQLLLEQKAAVDAKCSDGETALHLAAGRGKRGSCTAVTRAKGKYRRKR
jgi:ankyrin repeat protein